MDYCESKPHKILCGFLDFFCLSTAVRLVLALVVSIARVSFVSLPSSAIMLAVEVVLVVVYHARLSDKVKVLTLGEIIAGRIREAGTKRWINPYCRNRVGIYIFVFAVLVLYSNSVESLFSGAVPRLSTVVGKGLGIALGTLGFAMVARGEIKGVLIPTLLLLIGAVLFSQFGRGGIDRILGINFGVLSAFGFVVWVVYAKPGPPAANDEADPAEKQ